MRIPDLRRLSVFLVSGFIPVAVLWKGGKSLETTWMLLGVAWAVTLVYWLSRKKEEDINGGLWFSAMLLTLWTVISYLFSKTGNYGLDEVFRMGSFALILFWAARNNGDGTLLRKFASIVSWTAVFAMIIGIGVYVLQPVSRFVGPFFDFRFTTDYWPNAWAEFVLLTWPMVALHMKQKKHYPWLIAIGLLFGGLLLSYSRGAYIAFAGQLVLLAVCVVVQKKNMKHEFLMTLSVVIVAALTFYGANAVRSTFHTVQSLGAKVTLNSAEGTSSVDERFAFMKQAARLALEQPLSGYGPYSFRFVQTRLQEGVYATSDHPHNMLLKFAMEEGIPAAGLFLILLIGILLPVVPRIRKAKQDADVLLLVSVLGVLAHVMIDYNLQFVGNALPFWMMLGFLTPVSTPVIRPSLILRRKTEIMVATILIVFAILEGRHLIISSYGRHAEANGRYEVALKYYAASAGEIFSRDLHLSEAYLLRQTGRTDEAKTALTRYLRRNSLDARAWLQLGQTLEKEYEWELALSAYEQAYDLGKWNHPDALRGLVVSHFALMKGKAVDERRGEFDALLTAFHDAIVQNAHFIALGTVPEEYVTLTEEFAQIYPKDAGKYRTMGKEALEHAKTERLQFSARPAGRLW